MAERYGFGLTENSAPPLDAADEGHVYVVGSANRVKIGWSTKVIDRLSAIQSASAQALLVYAMIPAPEALERELHERFKSYRSHGEWFDIRGALLTWLVSGCGMDRRKRPGPWGHMERLQPRVNPNNLLSTADVAKEISVRSHLVPSFARRNLDFPKPIKRGRKYYFRQGDIDEWKARQWKNPKPSAASGEDG